MVQLGSVTCGGRPHGSVGKVYVWWKAAWFGWEVLREVEGRLVQVGSVTFGGRCRGTYVWSIGMVGHPIELHMRSCIIYTCGSVESAYAGHYTPIHDLRQRIVCACMCQVQASVLRKSPEVVVATPGRLIDHLRNTQSVGLEDLAVLVLDEADR